MKKLADTSTEQWLEGVERALTGSPGDRACGRGGAGTVGGVAWEELERLARGELAPARLAQLELQSETDRELRLALEAFRPLGAAALDRISERVASGGAASGPREVLGAPSGEPASREGVPERSARARSRARRIGAAAPLLAAAAALLLWLQRPAIAPLGEYRVEVAGALAESRGPASPRDGREPARLRVLPGARLELVVRPAVAGSTAVDAHVFIESAGERRPVEAAVARSGSGSLRLSLQLPASGLGDLVVIVARTGVAPSSFADARGERGLGWQRFRFALVDASPTG